MLDLIKIFTIYYISVLLPRALKQQQLQNNELYLHSARFLHLWKPIIIKLFEVLTDLT